ncbi:glycosyltransferase family 4 protein [Spirosoma fluviale]|uniref:Glycosyltransferase involved in cell wall bisynthesis n=1 Tax=Spirosoma fluviale TaxID=1597977 RepID=A0A286G983_9BACT|nr:glycosyltransferase family 4 protein [Spirosoma fluviale]SOD92032.1 Glycosyltransferase involved in cell wall bisynthesis [Spirosoma fluviale]
MNVLIATYLAPNSPSGVVTYTKALASDLADAGVGVHTVDATNTPVLWRKFLGILKRVMRPLGGAFFVLYDEFAYFTGIYLSARKWRNANIDLIHAQDPRSGVAAYLALGRRAPIVLTCHFNDDPVKELVDHFSLKPGFTKRLTSWYVYLFSYISNYIFVSNYAYNQSKHLLPANVNKQILRNTVRLAGSVSKSRPDGLAPDTFVISNVGYIDERKNQKLLLEIGRKLRSRGIHNFMIWLIGDGPKRADYEQLTQQFDLNNHVRFLGRQAAPWQLVAQSDLYVHTALNDNCPYSIVEAFAVETPVLALPVGGIPEMLPKDAGLFSGTKPAELATEVARYLDSTRRKQLTGAQRANAAVSFNHRGNLEKLLSFYRQTAGVPADAVTQLAPVL